MPGTRPEAGFGVVTVPPSAPAHAPLNCAVTTFMASAPNSLSCMPLVMSKVRRMPIDVEAVVGPTSP